VLRDLLVALCRTTDHEALAEAARLCTSEIVTNVYRHTAARLIHVDVIVAGRYVEVWVHDDLPKELPAPSDDTDREGGRGLYVVDQLADHWGASLYGGLIPTSKAVWFRLYEGGRGAESSISPSRSGCSTPPDPLLQTVTGANSVAQSVMPCADSAARRCPNDQ